MFSRIFQRLGIINWRTTLTGIGGFGLALTVMTAALRKKDFITVFTQMQTLGPIIAGIIMGIQGFVSKDSTVTGVGTQSAMLMNDNKLLTAQGDTVRNLPPKA